MPNEEKSEKRRVGEGWENYSNISERYATGVPVIKLLKPINPREETESFIGKEAGRHPAQDTIAALISSKRSLILVCSAITAAGGVATLVGIYSLIQAIMFGSPYPQMDAYPLIYGSLMLTSFGLLFSISFGVLAIRNYGKMKMLHAMASSSDAQKTTNKRRLKPHKKQ